jgi:uncharacterized protein
MLSFQLFFDIQKQLLDANFMAVREVYDEIDWDERLIGIVWPRGVGKSTLLVRYLSTQDLSRSLYISADSIYFLDMTLLDFAMRWHREYDGWLLIIDEIHQYRNWQQELKNIYDSIPTLRIIFSGSSSIDLQTGSYDLSRRARLYQLHGFTFREYINYQYTLDIPKYTLSDILTDHLTITQSLPQIPIIRYFREYLERGYYPYYVNEKVQDNKKILETIHKTIYDDIANYYTIKTENLIFFKKILNYLSVMEAGEININKISKTLEIDNKTVSTYLEIMEKGGLIRFLLKDIHGYNIMKNTSKLYLENTNIVYTITKNLLKEVSVGKIRENFFVQSLQNTGQPIVYSDIGDFCIWDMYFEIWWQGKTFRQISDQKHTSFLVLDDIVVWQKWVIPLYLFWLL